MATVIDEALELLIRDDDPHSIQEISKELGIPRRTCKIIADFLVKYDFVKLEGQKLTVNPKLRAIASSHVPSVDENLLIAAKVKPR